MIKTIRHTGIVVRDLQKSANFYRTLGFEDFSSAIEEGEFIDQVTGIKKVKVEWIKLKSADGNLIELLQYHSHSENKLLSKQPSNTLGCSHIAFGVTNIENFCEIIKKNGGSIVNLPVLSDNKKVKVAYGHDIDGVLMELVEVLESA